MQTTKPKVDYKEFLLSRKQGPLTVGRLIDRFIREMDGTTEQPGIRPLGATHRWMLRAIGRDPIAEKVAEQLTKGDVIDLARRRRQKVQAVTVMQWVTGITGVLKYAGSAWDDCANVSAAPVEAAKPFLIKNGIIGKSTPREQRPTDEQINLLLAYFAKQNEFPGTEIDMVKITLWQRASARRIGESCRLLWRKWNPVDQTIVVMGIKDPKQRNRIDTAALTEEASDLLWEWVYEMDARPELRTDEPRVLPFSSKSCSARFTLAKIDLEPVCPGITKTRLHDCRRDAISRLAEQNYTSNQIRMVSLHKTTAILDRTYNCPDPAKFKDLQPQRAAV